MNALTSDSQAFGFLEYFLRLSLHSSTTRIMEAWEVSNPQLTMQFEKRSKDTLTLDSWVESSKLSEGNQEEDLVSRGIHFGSGACNGMGFKVGRLDILTAATASSASGAPSAPADGIIRRRMVLCKIAVGRSYNATEDFAAIATIPDGYDSFVIDRKGVPLELKADEAPLDQLEYVVKDGAQVLPTYVVIFEHDPEKEKRSRQDSVCDNCEVAPAAVFCQADSANLCGSCDAQLHSSKLTAKHVRTALDAGPQTFSACRHHADKFVEFFCPTCSRPVCVHCKMVGHHSTGDAAKHKLITVAEAFRGVSEAARATDPLLDARKQRISSQIRSVVDRVKAVECNASDIQHQLEEIYKRAQLDLKNITKKKLNVLRGDMVELYRESAEIRNLEEFLEYQQSGGNATQFILDWAYHQRLRGESHSFAYFRETVDVHPDIKINGALQVHVESAACSSASSNSAGANIMLPLSHGSHHQAYGGGDEGSGSLLTGGPGIASFPMNPLMRQSTLLGDGSSRPRYSTGITSQMGGGPGALASGGSRSRGPTVDYTLLTKGKRTGNGIEYGDIVNASASMSPLAGNSGHGGKGAI